MKSPVFVTRWNLLLAVIASSVLWLGCEQEAPTVEKTPADKATSSPPAPTKSAAPEYAADAAGLKLLWTDLRHAIAAGETSKAATLGKGMLPSKADIQATLAEDATDAVEKVSAMHERMSPNDEQTAAKMFAGKPERTEIMVHSCKTEAIGNHDEFPGGAKRLAAKTLRAGLTFCEVEVVEPGKDLGTKYHLFFHNGTGWKMLGPIWRVLR